MHGISNLYDQLCLCRYNFPHAEHGDDPGIVKDVQLMYKCNCCASGVPMKDSECAGPTHCQHSDCSSSSSLSSSDVSVSPHLITIPIIYSACEPLVDILDADIMGMAPSTSAPISTILRHVHHCMHHIFANYPGSMRWQLGSVTDLHDTASVADLYVLLASIGSRAHQAAIESALTDSKDESSWTAFCGPKTKHKKVKYLFTPVDLSISVMHTPVYYTILAIRTLGHLPCMDSVPVQPVVCSNTQWMDIIRDKPLNLPVHVQWMVSYTSAPLLNVLMQVYQKMNIMKGKVYMQWQLGTVTDLQTACGSPGIDIYVLVSSTSSTYWLTVETHCLNYMRFISSSEGQSQCKHLFTPDTPDICTDKLYYTIVAAVQPSRGKGRYRSKLGQARPMPLPHVHTSPAKIQWLIPRQGGLQLPLIDSLRTAFAITDVIQSRWPINWQLGTTTDLASNFCAKGVEVYVIASSTNIKDWSILETRVKTYMVDFKSRQRYYLFSPLYPDEMTVQYYTIVAVQNCSMMNNHQSVHIMPILMLNVLNVSVNWYMCYAYCTCMIYNIYQYIYICSLHFVHISIPYIYMYTLRSHSHLTLYIHIMFHF